MGVARIPKSGSDLLQETRRRRDIFSSRRAGKRDRPPLGEYPFDDHLCARLIVRRIDFYAIDRRDVFNRASTYIPGHRCSQLSHMVTRFPLKASCVSHGFGRLVSTDSCLGRISRPSEQANFSNSPNRAFEFPVCSSRRAASAREANWNVCLCVGRSSGNAPVQSDK